MANFNEIIAGADVAHAHATYAHDLYKAACPISEDRLGNTNSTVLRYGTLNGGTVYLLKSYNTIVAMIDEDGDGINFLQYVFEYTLTSSRHIRKFFEHYCKENADVYIYKP